MTGKEIYERCIWLAAQSDCEKRKFGCVIVDVPFGQMQSALVFGSGFNKTASDVLKDFNCCRERADIASGTRTEYCRAIHAEMMALHNAPARHSGALNHCTLYVAGLDGNGAPFDNSKGFYCLPCAKELAYAGIPKIALASAETPKTGKWSIRTINHAVRESLEFTKGTKKV